jgi:cation transport ATPase
VNTLAQNSIHPLSRRIAEELKGRTDLAKYTVEEFSEEVGKGVSGWINNHFVKDGKCRFCWR